MRLLHVPALAAAILMASPAVMNAQGKMETSRTIEGGGISVPGWTGKIDAKEEQAGQTLKSAKLAKEGNALHVTTGPAVTYWNPAQQSDRELHGKGDFHRTEVHEPEQPSASVRHCYRR